MDEQEIRLITTVNNAAEKLLRVITDINLELSRLGHQGINPDANGQDTISQLRLLNDFTGEAWKLTKPGWNEVAKSHRTEQGQAQAWRQHLHAERERLTSNSVHTSATDFLATPVGSGPV